MLSQYFVTDLDGTLLRSDATISSYTVDVMNKAVENGMTIAYATARSIVSARKIVSAIPWNAPLIVYNGAMIVNQHTHQTLAAHLLSPDLTNLVIDLGREVNLKPFLFVMNSILNERVLHEKLDRLGNQQFYDSRPGD